MQIQMPEWLKGDILDVRRVVTYYLALQEKADTNKPRQPKIAFPKVGHPSFFLFLQKPIYKIFDILCICTCSICILIPVRPNTN